MCTRYIVLLGLYAEDTSPLFGYRTRYTFTLKYNIIVLLLFIRPHRKPNHTMILLEGRPRHVGAYTARGIRVATGCGEKKLQ